MFNKETGASDDERRVFGGVADYDEEFPCCVRIVSGEGSGSGVLIGPNVVLTAAHVLSPQDQERGFPHLVILGCDGRPGYHKETFRSRMVIRHDGYDPVRVENDIGLLILDKDVPQKVGDIPKDVRPLPLAAGDEVDVMKRVMVVGYGLTERGISGIRHKGLMFVGGEPARYGAHAYEFVAMAPGIDACKGDSGGPCLIRKEGQGGADYHVAAVVSRGIQSRASCGEGGIQVRVGPFRDWIERKAAEHGGRLTPGPAAGRQGRLIPAPGPPRALARSAALLALMTAASAAPARDDKAFKDFSETTPEERRDRIEAARRWAEEVARDDPVRYERELQNALARDQHRGRPRTTSCSARG